MNSINYIVRFFKTNLFFILIISSLASCVTLKIVKENNSSVIAISAISTGLGAKGFGIIITLENIDTQEKFISKSLSPTSPHSVIQNISPGKYNIKKVEIPVGNINYANWSDEIKDFFGQIEIEPNSKYYLGNFVGKRSIGRENVLRLRIENQDIPDRLIEKIENAGWKEGEFQKLYPYAKEELLVY